MKKKRERKFCIGGKIIQKKTESKRDEDDKQQAKNIRN